MKTRFIKHMKCRQCGAISAKGMVLLVLILLPILIIGFYEGRKAYWDAQVREMCAKDGGVKVYEVAKLPPASFNQWHQPNFYRPDQGENALGSEYVFIKDRTYLQHDNPDVWRTHFQVIRRSDGKMLAESIGYSRRGGDTPGPWHPSSFGCPHEYGDIPLLMKTFQEQEK